MNSAEERKVVIREAAAKGAEMLDQRWPGWHGKVNPAQLAMISWYRCIGGQLGGGYDEVTGNPYTQTMERLGLSEATAGDYGFTLDYLSPPPRPEDWRQLDRYWRVLIAQRRQRRLPDAA